ncbi:MAG: hypothetical protein R3199_10585 [Gemmatimonadota bacterium]|nr:hypothetical protein [Gemmatimonadota bacterium]
MTAGSVTGPGRAVPRVFVATRDRIHTVVPEEGELRPTAEVDARPTCLAADRTIGRIWCGTEQGVRRSDNGGETWTAAGLEGEEVTALAADPTEAGAAWAGTEPSAVYRSDDGGRSWARAGGLLQLPSSSEWSFPPRPETHHVRWISAHPEEGGRLWVAIEAGALVTTADGGVTWRDREPGGPYDTHEIAIHPDRPECLRISAGDGYYESDDGGATWRSPEAGLEVGYLRSVAVDPGDPDVVVVSAASGAHSAYATGRSDGRLYRRKEGAAWERVTDGWPEEPETIAPLLTTGREPGELWAADERGVHRSGDGGQTWERVAKFGSPPPWLRGLAVVEVG